MTCICVCVCVCVCVFCLRRSDLGCCVCPPLRKQVTGGISAAGFLFRALLLLPSSDTDSSGEGRPLGLGRGPKSRVVPGSSSKESCKEGAFLGSAAWGHCLRHPTPKRKTVLLSAFENRNLLCHSSAWNVLKTCHFTQSKLASSQWLAWPLRLVPPFLSWLSLPVFPVIAQPPGLSVTLLLLQPCPQACLPTTWALLPHLPVTLCSGGWGSSCLRVVAGIRWMETPGSLPSATSCACLCTATPGRETPRLSLLGRCSGCLLLPEVRAPPLGMCPGGISEMLAAWGNWEGGQASVRVLSRSCL